MFIIFYLHWNIFITSPLSTKSFLLAWIRIFFFLIPHGIEQSHFTQCRISKKENYPNICFQEKAFYKKEGYLKGYLQGCCESTCKNTCESRIIKWWLLTMLLMCSRCGQHIHTSKIRNSFPSPFIVSMLDRHPTNTNLLFLTPLSGFLLIWRYIEEIRRNTES